MMLILTDDERSLITTVAHDAAPEIRIALQQEPATWSPDVKNRLLSMLGDELVQTGFDQKYALTERGSALQSLMDRITDAE